MSTGETGVIVVLLIFLFLVIGNIGFSFLAELKNPPIGNFSECEGVRLHYLERGNRSAPCVVLFHGNGSMIQDFIISGLVDQLAKRYRVVCFDRPGFGYSQRPRARIWAARSQAALFVKALDQLGVRDPVVLGHSWGALVAVAIALQDNYPVRGLVLASGYYFPTRRWDFWLMSGPAVPVLGDLMRYSVAPVISWAILPALLKVLFAPRSVPNKFKDRFPISLMLRPKQLRAVAEESAFLIAEAARLQSLPGSYFPRNRRSAHRTRTGPTSTSTGRPFRSAPRERCRAHGDLCRRWRYFAGYRQFGGPLWITSSQQA